jgi:hypothetical protein
MLVEPTRRDFFERTRDLLMESDASRRDDLVVASAERTRG